MIYICLDVRTTRKYFIKLLFSRVPSSLRNNKKIFSHFIFSKMILIIYIFNTFPKLIFVRAIYFLNFLIRNHYWSVVCMCSQFNNYIFILFPNYFSDPSFSWCSNSLASSKLFFYSAYVTVWLLRSAFSAVRGRSGITCLRERSISSSIIHLERKILHRILLNFHKSILKMCNSYFSFSISILLVTHTYIVYGTRMLCELRIWTWRLYRFPIHIPDRIVSYSIRVRTREDPRERVIGRVTDGSGFLRSRVEKARVLRSVKFVSRSRDRDKFLASSSASPVRSHENTRLLLPRVEHIGILTYTNKCIVIQDLHSPSLSPCARFFYHSRTVLSPEKKRNLDNSYFSKKNCASNYNCFRTRIPVRSHRERF